MTDGCKFSVVTFSIFHLMPSFKTFHFSCSPHEGGVIDISPLSLTQKCIPLKSQLFEGSNSYQTPHRGQTLGFVSRSLTPRTQRKPKLCFTGFSKCPWGKHSCYSPYFSVPACIQCIFCPGHYLLSCQRILRLRRLFLILSRYFSCFQ